MKRMGKIAAKAARITNIRAMICPFFTMSPSSLIGVGDPLLGVKHHQKEGSQHQKQDVRRAGQFLHIQRQELIVHVVLEHVDIRVGIGAVEHVHLFVHLEVVDDAHEQHHESGGGQVDPGHVPELPPGPGPFQSHLLVVGFGNPVEPRPEQDDIVADVLPQKHHHQHRQAPLVPVHPLVGEAQLQEELVPQAVVVEEHLPEVDDGPRGHHQRQEQNQGGDDPAPLHLPQAQGQKQRHSHAQGHGNRHEQGAVVGGALEQGIGQGVGKVFQSHKLPGAHVVDEGIVQGVPKGHHVKQQHPRQAGQQEQPIDGGFPLHILLPPQKWWLFVEPNLRPALDFLGTLLGGDQAVVVEFI